MAKNKAQEAESGLSVVPAGGALVAPGGGGGGALVDGRDSTVAISRMAMYNDTPEEKVMYEGAGFKWGDYFDTLERKSFGPEVKIIPVAGWMSWAKFVKGQKAPVYSYKNEVPHEDLEWTTGTEGRVPPSATEAVNMICLVDGVAFPMLFMFKRTGLKAFQRVIEPLEQRYPHSVYKLGSENDKNSSAQAYKRVTAAFVGKSNDEQMAAVNALKAIIAKVKARAETLAEAPDAQDSIPV